MTPFPPGRPAPPAPPESPAQPGALSRWVPPPGLFGKLRRKWRGQPCPPPLPLNSRGGGSWSQEELSAAGTPRPKRPKPVPLLRLRAMALRPGLAAAPSRRQNRACRTHPPRQPLPGRHIWNASGAVRGGEGGRWAWRPRSPGRAYLPAPGRGRAAGQQPRRRRCASGSSPWLAGRARGNYSGGHSRLRKGQRPGGSGRKGLRGREEQLMRPEFLRRARGKLWFTRLEGSGGPLRERNAAAVRGIGQKGMGKRERPWPGLA